MAMHSAPEFDVAIVGAGLIGLSAAIALHEVGQSVVLVDANAPAKASAEEADATDQAWDTRIYALTPATVDWLQAAGVWPLVNEARINSVEAMALFNSGVGAREGAEAVELKAADANLNQLAYIAENRNLLQALRQKISTLKIPLKLGESCQGVSVTEEAGILHMEDGANISAKLLVAADGVNSVVRQQCNIAAKEKDFGQMALVANYAAEKEHANVARQWFAPHNTLALLPLPNQQVSMVWSVEKSLASELKSLSQEALAERVQAQAGNVLGTLAAVSERLSFSLKQRTASQLIAERVVLIGDAAHQIHPLAGQGANLGFRDIASLQAIIAGRHHLEDIGEKRFLRQYERSRKSDIASMNLLTSGLDSLFANEHGAIKQVVDWGMGQLNQHASMKKILIKQAVA